MVWTDLLISHTLGDWDVKFSQVLNGGPCMDVGTQKMNSVWQCAPLKPGSSSYPDGPEYQTPPVPVALHQEGAGNSRFCKDALLCSCSV